MSSAPVIDKFQQIQAHSSKVEDILDLIAETKAIDEEFGRTQESRTAGFDIIAAALKERRFRIVVIGEFSRGKSSLLNALLSADILPTANQQTTAINTFIQGVKEGEEPHLRLIYFDGREERLPWEAGSIEAWGTELDQTKKDARKEVERIEAFSDHPLLENKLVLIDTPGFEGILEAHEDIARRAMDEAHVALWIQSTEQLGGNAREWEFLRTSIANNFDKFITVINKWDQVLDPQDPREQKKSQSTRERESREIVVQNFRKFSAGALTDDKIAHLTREDNLMGVSALWASDQDQSKRLRSNISALAERIEEMCLREAEEEILLAPLHKLKNAQKNILDEITREYDDFNSTQTLEEREGQIQALQVELQNFELERNHAISNARMEHNFHARESTKTLQQELLDPLKELKLMLENQLTQSYVRRQLERGVKAVGLPAEIQDVFQAQNSAISEKWGSWRDKLEKTLRDLRGQFAKEMEQAGRAFEDSLYEIDFKLPALEIELDVDLSGFEAFHQQRNNLLERQEELEDRLDELEQRAIDLADGSERVKQVEREKERILRQIQGLGVQPGPGSRIEERQASGGIWREGEYYNVEVPDHSAMENWSRARAELARREKNIDAEVKRLQEEEYQKRKIRLKEEIIRRKVERDLERLRRETKEQEQRQAQEFEEAVESTLQRLKSTTIFRLERQIAQLENEVAGYIDGLFQDQLKELEAQVKENYLEPIQARQKSMEKVQEELERGEQARQENLARLEKLQDKMRNLMANTEALHKFIKGEN